MGFNSFPCNPYPISTEELNKGNNDSLNTRVTALEGDVSDLESQKANQITIALSFNPETTYNPGDLVYYNGLTYRCTNEHTGEWDADDFAATTIAGELDSLKSGLISIDKISQFVFNAETMTDFNALTTDKAMAIYQIGTTSGMANKPSEIDGFGVLVVFQVAGYIVQVWMPAGGGADMAHRNKAGSAAWTSWV